MDSPHLGRLSIPASGIIIGLAMLTSCSLDPPNASPPETVTVEVQTQPTVSPSPIPTPAPEPDPTSTPEPTPTLEPDPTSTPEPTPTLEPYDVDTVAHEDRPALGVSRYDDVIVIAESSVDRERLFATLTSHIEQYRGEAHAISVQVKSDWREPAPAAIGVYQWAPGGVWADAADGDAATWDGYDWREVHAPGKVDGAECFKPLIFDFVVAELFWNAYFDLEEEEAKAQISVDLDSSVEDVSDSLRTMLEWQYC